MLSQLGFRLGSILHLGFDAVLVSAFLAGVRRSTGLTYAAFTGREDAGC
jgi:Fungal protein of unknown function (DUF1748)